MIEKRKNQEKTAKSSQITLFLQEIDHQKGATEEQLVFSKANFGENILPKPPEKSLFLRILSQLKEPLTLVLIFVIIISIVTTAVFEQDLALWRKIIHYLEPLVIAIIIGINIFFSLIQEAKSKKAIEAISALNSPVATIIRKGQKISSPSNSILVGDIIEVSAGDLISADGYVLEMKNFAVQEAILTGESTSVHKQKMVDWTDINSQVFSGTSVLSGQAKILISAVGAQTRMGQIATLVTKTTEIESPLQQKIAKFSKFITIIAALLAIFFFFVYIFLVFAGDFSHFKEAIVVSLSLAVGFIPEGLVPLVSINLIIGIKRMAKNNAIVKDLKTIETLGAVSIVCSDKTGTITENKMEIIEVFYHQIPENTFWTQAILNTSAYRFFEENKEKYFGDPEEILLLKSAKEWKIFKEDLQKEYEFFDQIPFSSQAKFSAVFYSKGQKKHLFIKGAPEILLAKATNISQNLITKLTKMQEAGLRIFAFGHQEIENADFEVENLEKYLDKIEISGLIAFQDPPRKEIKEIITKLKQAQISTVMITGDNFATAKSVATNVGILDENSLSVDRQNWQKDDFWRENVEKFHLYSRSQPEDKLEIVNALQQKKQVVAMLGDGVNDAPSLKKANVGFAMGITGSQVSKQVANVVLADDNFSSLFLAIQTGRNIVANIRQLVAFLLIANFSMLLSVLFATLFFQIQIFSALQILWINVVSETFGGVALGLTSLAKNVMNQHFLQENQRLFSQKLIYKIAFWSFLITALSLISFWISGSSTITFLVISLCLASTSYLLATNQPIFSYHFSELKFLHLGMLASIFSVLFVAFVPGVSEVFSPDQAGKSLNYNNNRLHFLLLLMILAPFFIDQISKLLLPFLSKFTKKGKILA
ncbi:cation-translocating P-type ATPase [Mycoplasma sp. 'Moose RK']|uniref:cation-translocating P-type ATPase n=1 Tax=Mycoplasma sp. 'Moose RK' TaxID=2780095 RepID=UPI0018C336EE|nr:cation-translocating P-type ATPase [Mycoplasma sp. 'Moose RK']MBG0731094.1 cation-translocating P-type ATPase [Mycoplasma sp. 'Moose RK']